MLNFYGNLEQEMALYAIAGLCEGSLAIVETCATYLEDYLGQHDDQLIKAYIDAAFYPEFIPTVLQSVDTLLEI